jgi:hypothetical protein
VVRRGRGKGGGKEYKGGGTREKRGKGSRSCTETRAERRRKGGKEEGGRNEGDGRRSEKTKE